MKSCWPWSHDWTEWGKPEEWSKNQQMLMPDGTVVKAPAGKYLVQRRECQKCKMAQTRREYL